MSFAVMLAWPAPLRAQTGLETVLGEGALPLAAVAAALLAALAALIVAARRNIDAHRVRAFRSPTDIGRTAIVLLTLWVVCQVAVIGLFLWQISLFDAVVRDEPVTLDILESSDTAVALAAGVSFVLYLAGGTVFLCWLSRVRANLPALGVDDARWGPGWAIGWWFVPFMNLFRPCQLTTEVYQASDAASTETWRLRSTGIVGLWWLLWLASVLAAAVPEAILRSGEWAFFIGDALAVHEVLVDSTKAEIAVRVVGILGALAMVRLIRRIGANQVARWSQVVAFGETAATEPGMAAPGEPA
ncbi:MAG: DUF4328 domain-containing protein [Alphaproteobacteria bacterium]